MAHLLQFQRLLIHFAIQAGGSYGTKDARIATVRQFVSFLMEENRQINSIRNKDLRDFIKRGIENGRALGTMQNQAAHLRALQRLANPRKPLSYTNQELGISGRCRNGTKRALFESEFRQYIESIDRLDVRTAALLQRYVGLRAMEAIRCGKSLTFWFRSLKWGWPLRIIHGTKGKRLRLSEVPYPDLAVVVVARAIEIARPNHWHLIRARRDDLKSAVNTYRYRLAAAGFVGDISPHALRYTYACDLAGCYDRMGMPPRERDAAIGLCLGHGDGRGCYVRQVYFQPCTQALMQQRGGDTGSAAFIADSIEWLSGALEVDAHAVLARSGVQRVQWARARRGLRVAQDGATVCV